MPLTLAHLTPEREQLLTIMQAALDAVEPGAALRRALRREGDLLFVGERRYALADFDKVWVIGAGKAAAPMAQAVETLLGDWLSGGIVVVKYGHLAPLHRVELREAAHPLPDEAGLAAGEAILQLADHAGQRDLVLCLLSGGGSALLEALYPPLTLDDLQATTATLLASGATINEMNALRKHLSRVKGGQLARAVAPATLVTLLLSDVVGSPLDVIASGPTVADSSTWAEVGAIVQRYALAERLVPNVRSLLDQGLHGDLPETPKEDAPFFRDAAVLVVGDNARAAEAAVQAAALLGLNAALLTTFLEGEAREVARVAVALGREVQAHARPVPAPACLVLGGETTVRLGAGSVGQGGRNQELALSAALAMAGRTGLMVGALATDGSDGPTDSAGAIVDGGSVARAAAQGLDAADHLARHDAYPLLDATGDLLRSGPTNTNVNDLLFVWVAGAPATITPPAPAPSDPPGA